MGPSWRERDSTAPSVFQPESLLREARRQRGLPLRDVPAICALDPDGVTLYRGATWTTDAPCRETEAALLYAFATARRATVACFAHVTNAMGQQEGSDFEKGEADGTVTALRLIESAAAAFGSISCAQTHSTTHGCS